MSLRPLDEACRIARSGWTCLPNPLIGWGREGTPQWKVGVLLRHVALVLRCWRAARARHILVREFSTMPLLMVFPLISPLRRRIYFLMHHNLQWAARSRLQAWGLTWLTRMGARWALLETQDLPDLQRFGIPSQRNLVLPHPAPPLRPKKKHPRKPVIGVVGHYRPEKGMDALLPVLLEAFPDCEVVVGSPNEEDVALPSITVVDTSQEDHYRGLLAECDVLVQNNTRESYLFRASGPVADAVASGTAVVVPDYPVLRHQVTWPTPVGEVFTSVEQLQEVVRVAIEGVRATRYDYAAWTVGRSARAIAEVLDEAG